MMTRASRPRNRTFDRLEVDVVTRPDGRYLLYYSWPDEPVADVRTAPAREIGHGVQQPWTPEAGPPERYGRDDERSV